MHVTERELIKITGYKVQRKFSDRQDYLKSIFTAVQKLEDEQFNDMTDEAAKWANACVEVVNVNRHGELPDFDEIGDGDGDDDEDDDSVNSDEDEAEEDPEADGDQKDLDHQDQHEPDDDPEPELALEKPSKKEVKPKIPRKPKNKPKFVPKAAPEVDDSDVILDKWGCMEGSKNSQALVLFEKGATTKEVKDAIGGTYYNLLSKMVQNGHRLDKTGSLMKIIHKDVVKSPPSKKPKK